MTQQFANNATSKLASPIAAGDLSCALTPGDGAKFPGLGTAGDFFMGTLINGFTLLGINPYVQEIAKGLIIVLAVIILAPRRAA